MPRVVNDQTNPWGRQQGVDAQRSDLWVVDFTNALTGIKAALASATTLSTGVATPYVPPRLASYFAASISLPELKVRADDIRRDSRPYKTPSWDDPCESIRMTFLLDCHRANTPNLSPYRSDIYQMLDTWRACTRAGRQGMSNEFAITLNANYRIDYAFDVQLSLLTGTIPQVSALGGIQGSPSIFAGGAGGIIAGINSAAASGQSALLNGDLIVSMQYRLVNCWLSSFKVAELSYDAAKVLQIETTFYSEDIMQSPPGT